MEIIRTKHATFSNEGIEIVFRHKPVFIPIDNITRLHYIKPTFKNYILTGLFRSYPEGAGLLTVWLETNISNQNHFNIGIKLHEVQALPAPFASLVEIT